MLGVQDWFRVGVWGWLWVELSYVSGCKGVCEFRGSRRGPGDRSSGGAVGGTLPLKGGGLVARGLEHIYIYI